MTTNQICQPLTSRVSRHVFQRRIDRILARLRAASLDAQLAADRPPEASRLLTVRAAALLTPRSRKALAGWWVELLRRAQQQPPGFAGVPVTSARILAAEGPIRELVATLQGPEPVAVRGVAAASNLLRDGVGPVYNPRSRMDLTTAVRVAQRHLGTDGLTTAPLAS